MKVVFFRISSKSAKVLFVFLVVIAVVLITRINYLLQCDEHTSNQIVKLPDGSAVLKYNQTIKVAPFSNLSKSCHFVDGRIHCPDVRKHGETMLRQVQLVAIRMLKVIDIICEKHSINYWLMSGTLLGAYRKKRLIPWDNDGDIGLLEEDYIKLMEAFRTDLPEDLFLQTVDSDPPYAKNKWVMAKLRDRNSCYGHCIRVGCDWHDGLQIDIFVFKRSNPSSNEIVSMTTGRFKLDITDILPTKRILIDGVEFSAPGRTESVLETLFGPSYMTPISSQCPEYGFMAIPWHSCEYLKSLSATERNQILDYSMVHGSWFFWYFG